MLMNNWSPGQHAFSRDGRKWTVSTHRPYEFAVHFTDGTTVRMRRRERPQLLLSPEGRPLYFSSAVLPPDPGGVGMDSSQGEADHTYTLVVKINTT
jgi:hypothetical protein